MCVLDVVLAAGHIGYRKHYTTEAGAVQTIRISIRNPPPPLFLSPHPKNSDFWHQKRKILRWIQEEICFWKMHALHFRKTNKKFPCHWRLNCSGFTFLLLRLPAKQQPQSPAGSSMSVRGASPERQLGLFDRAMLLNNMHKCRKCSTATSHPGPLLASVLQMFHQL